jgi:hypothetical protein
MIEIRLLVTRFVPEINLRGVLGARFQTDVQIVFKNPIRTVGHSGDNKTTRLTDPARCRLSLSREYCHWKLGILYAPSSYNSTLLLEVFGVHPHIRWTPSAHWVISSTRALSSSERQRHTLKVHSRNRRLNWISFNTQIEIPIRMRGIAHAHVVIENQPSIPPHNFATQKFVAGGC